MNCPHCPWIGEEEEDLIDHCIAHHLCNKCDQFNCNCEIQGENEEINQQDGDNNRDPDMSGLQFGEMDPAWFREKGSGVEFVPTVPPGPQDSIASSGSQEQTGIVSKNKSSFDVGNIDDIWNDIGELMIDDNFQPTTSDNNDFWNGDISDFWNDIENVLNNESMVPTSIREIDLTSPFGNVDEEMLPPTFNLESFEELLLPSEKGRGSHQKEIRLQDTPPSPTPGPSHGITNIGKTSIGKRCLSPQLDEPNKRQKRDLDVG